MTDCRYSWVRQPIQYVLSLILLSACSTAPQSEQVQVVATSTILQDLAQQVAGDTIAVDGILEPGEDPHVYEPTPRDTQRLESADLVLYNGYNLEPALIKLIQSSNKSRSFAVGEVVQPLQMEQYGRQVADPHVWGNAENAIAMTEGIRDRLVEQFPDNEAVLQANAAQVSATLERLHAWIQQQTDTIPDDQRQLITTHDAFQYYADAYGLTIGGTLIGMSTEEQPSAQTVKRLVESIRQSNVPTIFAETTINPALIQTVAQEAGVQLAEQKLYSDSIGPAGSDASSYVDMLVVNTRTIVDALEGQSQPFNP